MKKRSIYFIIFLMVFSLNACIPEERPLLSPTLTMSTLQATNSQENSDVTITLERTICYGSCPAYRITISSNGKVVYEGLKFVMTEGIQESSISQEKITELISEFKQIEFFSLPDYIAHNMTDMPSAILSLSMDGVTKTVKHYFGDRDAPKELFLLENKVDIIVNSKQWIGDSAFEILNFSR